MFPRKTRFNETVNQYQAPAMGGRDSSSVDCYTGDIFYLSKLEVEKIKSKFSHAISSLSPKKQASFNVLDEINQNIALAAVLKTFDKAKCVSLNMQPLTENAISTKLNQHLEFLLEENAQGRTIALNAVLANWWEWESKIKTEKPFSTAANLYAHQLTQEERSDLKSAINQAHKKLLDENIDYAQLHLAMFQIIHGRVRSQMITAWGQKKKAKEPDFSYDQLVELSKTKLESAFGIAGLGLAEDWLVRDALSAFFLSSNTTDFVVAYKGLFDFHNNIMHRAPTEEDVRGASFYAFYHFREGNEVEKHRRRVQLLRERYRLSKRMVEGDEAIIQPVYSHSSEEERMRDAEAVVRKSRPRPSTHPCESLDGQTMGLTEVSSCLATEPKALLSTDDKDPGLDSEPSPKLNLQQLFFTLDSDLAICRYRALMLRGLCEYLPTQEKAQGINKIETCLASLSQENFHTEYLALLTFFIDHLFDAYACTDFPALRTHMKIFKTKATEQLASEHPQEEIICNTLLYHYRFLFFLRQCINSMADVMDADDAFSMPMPMQLTIKNYLTELSAVYMRQPDMRAACIQAVEALWQIIECATASSARKSQPSSEHDTSRATSQDQATQMTTLSQKFLSISEQIAPKANHRYLSAAVGCFGVVLVLTGLVLCVTPLSPLGVLKVAIGCKLCAMSLAGTTLGAGLFAMAGGASRFFSSPARKINADANKIAASFKVTASQ